MDGAQKRNPTRDARLAALRLKAYAAQGNPRLLARLIGEIERLKKEARG
jgi:hypothetical protein